MQVNNIKIYDDFDFRFNDDVNEGSNISQSTLYKNIFIDFIYQVNSIANTVNDVDILFDSLFDIVKKYFTALSYNILILHNNEKFYSRNNFEYDLDHFLISSGILDWLFSEKKSAIIPDPERYSTTNQIYIFIFPFHSIDFYGAVCFNTNFPKSDISKEMMLTLESAVKLVGNKALSIVIEKKLQTEVEKKKTILNTLYEFNKYVAIGELCTATFHDLKNRTQVLVSSIELIKKIDLTKDIDKLRTVVDIMSNEVPRFSKIIRVISDVSKTLLNDKSMGYISIYDIVFQLKNTIETTQIAKNLKINIDKKFDGIKIFSSPNSIFEILFLLLNEINKSISAQIEIDFLLKERNKRIDIELKIKLNEMILNEIINFVNENDNINFAIIKSMITSFKGSLITKLRDNELSIIIDFPQRCDNECLIN